MQLPEDFRLSRKPIANSAPLIGEPDTVGLSPSLSVCLRPGVDLLGKGNR